MKFLFCKRLRPRPQIRVIAVEKSTTLFYVQKNHRAFRKAIPACRGRGCPRISKPGLDRILFIGKLAGSSPLEQKQKAESVRLDYAPLADPGITFFAGRRAQPIACEG